ncbi:DUF2489 domain-containing protein [Gilvimarinus sp. DA14]|uniref:DUF2489 domain-containing protein n=1 Tax=Gilvimarinus sp. DA14 TaxID=2956798 RepID=UPI0020B86050|nr:DUF2489 domain-containing protein [Gilvimarinus sp. DA14]UTF60906.1 DUF2489 domain-containing protein [Gilvimarinus sp. DA14]
MNHEDYVNKKKKRVIEVAQGMLDGSVDYLEGSIELASLSFQVEAPDNDADFIKFIAIASEIDHLPIGKVRQYWSPNALERNETEIKKSKKWAKEFSLEHCKSLVARYSA